MKEPLNTPYLERQIELLEKYYVVDREKKEITIDLNYDKASELLVEQGGKEKSFNIEVIDKIRLICDKFPIAFKVKVNIHIKEYEDINVEELNQKFNDTLELTQYRARREKSFKWFLGTILVLLGVILLFLNIVGKTHDWFGNETNVEIITEVIDIAAWVFVWEAVTLVFLEPTEETTLSIKFKKRLSSINYFNANGDTILSKNSSEIFSNWIEEDNINRIAKGCLLFSSAAFLAMSFYSYYSIYLLVLDFQSGESELTPILLTSGIIADIIFGFIELLAGLSGFAKYTHKDGKLSKLHSFFAILLLTYIVYGIIVSSIFGTPKTIITTIFSSVFAIMYILSWAIDYNNKRKN